MAPACLDSCLHNSRNKNCPGRSFPHLIICGSIAAISSKTVLRCPTISAFRHFAVSEIIPKRQSHQHNLPAGFCSVAFYFHTALPQATADVGRMSTTSRVAMVKGSTSDFFFKEHVAKPRAADRKTEVAKRHRTYACMHAKESDHQCRTNNRSTQLWQILRQKDYHCTKTTSFSRMNKEIAPHDRHTIVSFGIVSEISQHQRHGKTIHVANIFQSSVSAPLGGKHALQHAPRTAISLQMEVLTPTVSTKGNSNASGYHTTPSLRDFFRLNQEQLLEPQYTGMQAESGLSHASPGRTDRATRATHNRWLRTATLSPTLNVAPTCRPV